MNATELVLAIGSLVVIWGGLLGYRLLGYRHDLARARRYRDWVAERQRILRELEASPPAPPAAGADLTEVSGIGPHTAARLKAAGLGTVEALSRATVEELAQVSGFGPKRAREVIREARRLLGRDAGEAAGRA